MQYTFENTPQLSDLRLEVERAGEEIRFHVSGPQADAFLPLIKLYYDWFNRLGPIAEHEGRNVYSLYLPAIPSGGDARLLEGIFRDKLYGMRTPRAVTIGVTHACQCGCIHCSAEDNRDNGEPLRTEEIRRIVSEGLALGLTNVTFTGGEPLLREDLEALIAGVSAEKAVSGIFTNGALLDAERADSLKSAGLQVVKASLDSPDPFAHDRLRQRAGSFREVEKGVQAALEAGLLVGISTYATNESVGKGRLTQIAALAAEWKVHEISVFDVIPTGRLLREDEMIMDEDTRKDLMKEAAALNREFRGRPRISTQSWTNSPSGFAAYFGCLAGTYQYHVTAYGDFTPCDFTPISFGNVRSESIESLWQKLADHPAYCKHRRECRMQSPAFRERYIRPIPEKAPLPYPIEKLEADKDQ
jgi:MoaA/NifB/PqqE/SkfB family radical SAM enzyme